MAQLPAEEQWHLATYSMSVEDLTERGITVEPDQPRARILRSVFMKPEHEEVVDDLVEVLEVASQRTFES